MIAGAMLDQPASQAQASGVFVMSQNCNMQSMYTDVPIFLAQKNTKNVTEHHVFFSNYMLHSAFNFIIVMYGVLDVWWIECICPSLGMNTVLRGLTPLAMMLLESENTYER